MPNKSIYDQLDWPEYENFRDHHIKVKVYKLQNNFGFITANQDGSFDFFTEILHLIECVTPQHPVGSLAYAVKTWSVYQRDETKRPICETSRQTLCDYVTGHAYTPTTDDLTALDWEEYKD